MPRKSPKKRKLADLPAQPDPRAELDAPLLVSALQPLRKQLEEDLLARAKESPALARALKDRHAAEKQAERTADTFAVWQRSFVEQVAAAWILSLVFIRTLEDRGLLESARIAGPGAMDSQRTFLQLAPSLSEREYLQTCMREMTRLPAAAPLFDRHNPIWMLTPSAEGARALLTFFRAGGDETPSLRFGQPDTRFLGDLYQDLNENVRARYALLQTPDFVERFILDRTLEPAIEQFGLDDTDLIDPTCGSGHFLLGAFDRLFEHRRRAEPGKSARDAAHEALDHIYGADINPYAVAIAKFRLTLSYLEKAGFAKLSEAPQLPLHLAVADSLLYNPQHEQRELFHLEGAEAAKWEKRAFDFEDEQEARDVLHREYAAVVGNPPYITPKDRALRDSYRKLYRSASMQYSLAVPFCERFFQLARKGGRVGQITANSFMKREFGKKLISEFLPTVNLDLIVNSSGAYIPGHGTPTVLLFGTRDAPRGPSVLAVLARRGEPSTPDDPAKGHVWRSIAEHFAEVGFENDYVSVAAVERDSLREHPWSLAGGGAGDLKALLESRAETTLGAVTVSIGRVAHTGADEAYVAPEAALRRAGLKPEYLTSFVEGEVLRDWAMTEPTSVLFPYDAELKVAAEDPSDPRFRWLWPYRTMLWLRREPNGNHREIGKTWYEFSRFHPERYVGPGIAFAFVATHNHFVLDRGGKVFNRSAPIIKLPETATEEDHLALLAYLNSSTACFWMKQVFYPKERASGDKSTEKMVPEKDRYEFAGTGLNALPLPRLTDNDRAATVALAREALELAHQREQLSGTGFVQRYAAGETDDGVNLAAYERERASLIRRLAVLQEEIDWLVYAAFELAPPYQAAVHQEADPQERPFIAGARCADPVWRARAQHTESSQELRLLESPMYKRLWTGRRGVFGHSATTFRDDVATAAADWIQTEAERELEGAGSAVSIGALANTLVARNDVARVVALIAEPDTRTTCRDVLARADAVPYLAALRYTDKGLEKRVAWERTWDLQRREDAGEKVGEIPVPPKYDQKDFRDPNYYRLRGKLDVPKERFISYPGCESDEDGEPVYGWAGWDHAQRAQALVALYNDRKLREGWPKDRLIPMLAGVLELLPWLKQWHSEPMPDYDTTFFEAYDAFLANELRDLSVTREHLTAWRPTPPARVRSQSVSGGDGVSG